MQIYLNEDQPPFIPMNALDEQQPTEPDHPIICLENALDEEALERTQTMTKEARRRWIYHACQHTDRMEYIGTPQGKVGIAFRIIVARDFWPPMHLAIPSRYERRIKPAQQPQDLTLHVSLTRSISHKSPRRQKELGLPQWKLIAMIEPVEMAGHWPVTPWQVEAHLHQRLPQFGDFIPWLHFVLDHAELAGPQLLEKYGLEPKA